MDERRTSLGPTIAQSDRANARNLARLKKAEARSGVEDATAIETLKEIRSIAKQAEVYHRQLGGATRILGDIFDKADAALRRISDAQAPASEED